jgi:PhnB protein
MNFPGGNRLNICVPGNSFGQKLALSLFQIIIISLKSEKMATVNPYLAFNGNCEEAFIFYKSVFGGEFRMVSRFKDMPAMPGQDMPESMKHRIMHVSLPISNETILMGSDSNPRMGDVTTGQNVSLSVSTLSKSEADKIFNALSQGGKITMPISDAFWGSYFGMLVDKFGIIWMVSSENK